MVPDYNFSFFFLNLKLNFLQIYILQGARINMNNQLLNHQYIESGIVNMSGDKESAAKYLCKCIYTVGITCCNYISNYISNYLLPQLYPTSRLHTPDQYARVLTQQYSQQLKVFISSWISFFILLLQPQKSKVSFSS